MNELFEIDNDVNHGFGVMKGVKMGLESMSLRLSEEGKEWV